MPPKWTSRRLRWYLPESQERVEVGSADEEALPPRGVSPPPGSARVDFDLVTSHNTSRCNMVVPTFYGVQTTCEFFGTISR